MSRAATATPPWRRPAQAPMPSASTTFPNCSRADGRAVAEGLDVEFRLGDIENLPVDEESYDAVLSVFGAMFAPDHQRAADEIIRAARPGGTVGLASWTPDGFIGQMFDVITRHVPAPPGIASPLLWGTEEHLHGLFGAAAADARSVLRTCTGDSRPPNSSSRSSAAGTDRC